MASVSSLLSEERFQCSICLDVFTDPVSTACGHNFCRTCISGYWNSTALCQCPLCMKVFENRTDLSVNTFISEMAAQFKKSVEVKPASSHAEPGEVTCNVCMGQKLKAMKSCLECLTSYCESHLEPHQRVTGLKRHKLIDPVKNLEDRMCKKHSRLLELFCRTDQMCVCQFCTETDHKTHHTIPLEAEYGEKMAQLGKTKLQVKHMIQERLQRVQEIKHSVELNKRDAEGEIAGSQQVFTVLVRTIERSQAKLIEVIEGKRKAAERRATELIQELEQEIMELKGRYTKLEQLLKTEDFLHFFQSPVCPNRLTTDWSDINVHSHLSVGNVRRALSQLEETLYEEIESELQKLCDAELKTIQRCTVDVTLDPETANPHLVLSQDGKEVRYEERKQNLRDIPKRIENSFCVLGKEGFSSGCFYYEVQVKGKLECFLGVASESINRKCSSTMSPEDGYWAVELMKFAATARNVQFSLTEKIQRVGVFVDYEEGQVSFYDVENICHIYSYTGNTFTGKLYPLLNPCDNEYGPNSAPLVISAVNHTE